MRTRAAVLGAMGASAPYATSKPLRIEELELDPPGPGEVLVRIKAAGLCHSDLSVINGDRPRPLPMALGHEAAGIVEELGPGVEDLARGDHVVCVFVPSCGHCEPCAEGRPALCEPGAAANGAGHAAGRRPPAAPPGRHAGQPSPGRLGVRRIRHRLAPLAGQDRPGAAARGGGPVRLRRAHRRGCGGQHRPHPGRRLGGGDRAGRGGPVLAPGGDRGRGARGRRHRPCRRQARLRPPARRHRHLQRQGPRLRRAGAQRHAAAGSSSPSSSRARPGRWSWPTGSPAAAAPR